MASLRKATSIGTLWALCSSSASSRSSLPKPKPLPPQGNRPHFLQLTGRPDHVGPSPFLVVAGFRPVPLHLVPHHSADRARALRTQDQQLRSAKGTHRIRRRLNRCQSRLQCRLLLCTKQMHKREDCPHGRRNPQTPKYWHSVRIVGNNPGNRREEHQNK